MRCPILLYVISCRPCVPYKTTCQLTHHLAMYLCQLISVAQLTFHGRQGHFLKTSPSLTHVSWSHWMVYNVQAVTCDTSFRRQWGWHSNLGEIIAFGRSVRDTRPPHQRFSASYDDSCSYTPESRVGTGCFTLFAYEPRGTSGIHRKW